MCSRRSGPSTSALLPILLVLSLAAAAQAVPASITANPALVVVPQGQTQGQTTITWTAGSDFTYGEVYYTTNNANQQELGRGHDGTKTLAVTVGTGYQLWMITYPGLQGAAFQVIAKLNVFCQQGDAAAPPPPRPRAPVTNLRVQPGTQTVVMTFNAAPGQVPVIEVSKAPVVFGNGRWTVPQNQVAGGFLVGGNKATGEYRMDLTVGEGQFEVGKSYWYIIDVNGADGKRAQVTGTFSTKSQIATVVYDRIHILNDSDPMGSGELSFKFWVNWGDPTAKSRALGSFDHPLDWPDGHWSDLNMDFTIAGAPDHLTLAVDGWDDDGGLFYDLTHLLKPFGEDVDGPLDGPHDTGRSECNVAKGEIDLSASPGAHATIPFKLFAMLNGTDATGDLLFEVFGHVDVNRETLGSTGSGLTTAPPPIWETTPIAPPGPAAYVTFLYALRSDGILLWYRHDGARDGAKAWQGPRKVASGWDQYTQILPGGGNILYGITKSGELHWYRHNGFNTGAAMGTRLTALPPESAPGLRFVADGPVRINPRDGVSGTARDHRIDPAIFGLGGTPAWDGPKVVGRGWGGFKQVFSGGDGIFYTVTQDGHLEWRRHLGYQSGGGMDTWEGPKTIAAGWGDYTKVFSIGNGVIYAINPAGQIWWAKHLGYLDGAATWQKMRNEPNQRAGTSDRARVGAEWNGYTQVFSAGVITPGAVAADKLGAVIYAVNPAGKLLWLNHPFYATGERAWLPAQEAGSGWDAFKQIVALIPTTTPVGGGVR